MPWQKVTKILINKIKMQNKDVSMFTQVNGRHTMQTGLQVRKQVDLFFCLFIFLFIFLYFSINIWAILFLLSKEQNGISFFTPPVVDFSEIEECFYSTTTIGCNSFKKNQSIYYITSPSSSNLIHLCYFILSSWNLTQLNGKIWWVFEIII